MANSPEVFDASAPDTDSEAKTLAKILVWSKDCPEWQRDALRRLCIKGELSEDDLTELTVLCKNKGKGAVVLSAEHVPDPEAATSVVTLRAIHGAESINALKPGERLTVNKSGLTVVYGDNGSGKSGYVRILKKVCRARILKKENKIHPNIYEKESGHQKAVIDFIASGQNRSHEWRSDQAGDRLLSSISVFDSRTANVHVDEVNNVAYTPFPMRVLERLAEASMEIKKRINTQIHELERQTPKAISQPGCHEETSVGKLIARLSGDTSEQQIRDLAKLNDQDKERLTTLKTDLGNDPAKGARQVETLKNRLDTFNASLEAMKMAIDDGQVSQLAALRQAFQTARAAAATAASNLFADQTLPDIGAPVWRALWEAARVYSQKQAYPDSSFPFIGDRARCVLCHQELDVEAANRLTRFEAFVKDETKRKEEEAATAYRAALDNLSAVDIAAADIPPFVAIIRDELSDDALAMTVRSAVVTLKWRMRAIRLAHKEDNEVRQIPEAETWPSEALSKHSASLLTRIKALRAEDQSDERKHMLAEFNELADREWLAVIQEDVITETERRKMRADLANVQKDTATNRITAKSDEIAEHLVTNALRAQFSKEINKLGVAGLAIELRKEKTSYGVPHFRVSLIRKPDAQVGEILSEGEHRCVALAAFLAELATTQGRSAIVFDDPVSSLDHMHREDVADRLAQESQHRQVIVFTHDLAFLFLLDQACRDINAPVAFRCITRGDEYAGFCQQDPPARAQPIDRVVEGMAAQLGNEKILYERGDHAAWERTVDALQKRLRWTWERAVEEAVGPVIKRLSNKVETKGLAKITTITMEDCLEMRKAYGRCSTLLHSSADALNKPLPKPQTIEDEIFVLRKWVLDIRERQSKIDYLQ